MQKVITIATHTNLMKGNESFAEKEYPTLDAYLKDGYKVVQVIPVVTNSSSSFMYSLTFVLEK